MGEPFDSMADCAEAPLPVVYEFRPKVPSGPSTRDHNITEVAMHVASSEAISEVVVRLDDCKGGFMPVLGVRLDEGALIRSGLLPYTDKEFNTVFRDRSGQVRVVPAQNNAEIKKKEASATAVETPRTLDHWVTFQLARPIQSGDSVCAQPPDFGNATFINKANETVTSSQCLARSGGASPAEGEGESGSEQPEGADGPQPTPSPSLPGYCNVSLDGVSANLCGLGSGEGNCFCDEGCAAKGDCCHDACDVCNFGCGDANSTAVPAPVTPAPQGPAESGAIDGLSLPVCVGSAFSVSYELRPRKANVAGPSTRDHPVTEVELLVANGVPVSEVVIRMDDCKGNFLPVNSVRLDEGALIRSGLLPLETPTSTIFVDRSSQNRSIAAQVMGTPPPRRMTLWATFEMALALSPSDNVCASPPDFGFARFSTEDAQQLNASQCVPMSDKADKYENNTASPSAVAAGNGTGVVAQAPAQAFCEGLCFGAQGSPEGQCFCDERCCDFGDCCPDYELTCDTSCAATPTPTSVPTQQPTTAPVTPAPTPLPTTAAPSTAPTSLPTAPVATPAPTPLPTTAAPTTAPTPLPTSPITTPAPTPLPTTAAPTAAPTPLPVAPVATPAPTRVPTARPTDEPTPAPPIEPGETLSPTEAPTRRPTPSPTRSPTKSPTSRPTLRPTDSPTKSPTRRPTPSPTLSPTALPVVPGMTESPTKSPTRRPTPSPTKSPTDTARPTQAPTRGPDRRRKRRERRERRERRAQQDAGR